MSKDNTGGPAFPTQATTVTVTNDDDDCYSQNDTYDVPASSGMTLRDYFAAKAMQAMVGNYRVVNHGDDVTTTEQHREMMLDTNSKTGEHEGAAEIATDAYAIADAMIAARKEDK